MNITAIKNTAIGVASKAKFGIQKYSPEILLGTGIVGIVSGTVLACKATLKADKVLDEYHDKLNTVEDAHSLEMPDYTEADYKKDLIIVKTQTAMEFVKLYGPAVGCIIGGITCVCSSYGIMRKRNLALVAAYSAVQEAFNDYRKRVIEEFGEEKDQMLRCGTHNEKITVDENGKKKKEDVKTLDGAWRPSGYAKIFDETNSYYVKNAEKNLMFLTMQQSYANDLLNIRGHVFLNEVYDMLGFPRTQAGSIVGWKKGHGDGYIDFGIFDVRNPKASDFVNGYERAVILDFNVDGVIWNLI